MSAPYLTRDHRRDALRESFRFMLANAGYVTPPGRAQCALDLARAETAAKAAGYYYVCEPDPDSWAFRDSLTDSDVFYIASLCDDDGNIVASVGGVDCSDTDNRDYWRVLVAELAGETFTDYHHHHHPTERKP